MLQLQKEMEWHPLLACRCFCGCWWSCSRWDDGWSLSDVPRVHPGTFRKNFVSLGRFKKHSLNLDLQCSLLVNLFYYFQSFFAGLAASGAITSALRLVTKAAFENSRDGLSKGASMLETTMDKYTFSPVDLYLIYLLAWKFMHCSSPQYHSSLSCYVFCYMLSSSLSCQLWSTIFQKQLQRDLWWSLLILLLVESKIAQIQQYCINCQQVLYFDTNLLKLNFVWFFQSEVDNLSTKQLLPQNRDYALDMFLIYMLTLLIFSGFLVADTGSHRLGSW